LRSHSLCEEKTQNWNDSIQYIETWYNSSDLTVTESFGPSQHMFCSPTYLKQYNKSRQNK